MRLQALRRGRFLCARCGRSPPRVDHVVPCELGGRDVPANLRSLCSRCHAELHAGRGHRPMWAEAETILTLDFRSAPQTAAVNERGAGQLLKRSAYSLGFRRRFRRGRWRRRGYGANCPAHTF